MPKLCGKTMDNLRTNSRTLCVHSSTVLRSFLQHAKHQWTSPVFTHSLYSFIPTSLSTVIVHVSHLLAGELYLFSTEPITTTNNFKKGE